MSLAVIENGGRLLVHSLEVYKVGRILLVLANSGEVLQISPIRVENVAD